MKYSVIKDHDDFPGIGLIQLMKTSKPTNLSPESIKTYRIDEHNSSMGYYRYDYQVSEIMLLTTKVFVNMARLKMRTYAQFSS